MVPMDNDLVNRALEIGSQLFHWLDNPQELTTVPVGIVLRSSAFPKVDIDGGKEFRLCHNDSGRLLLRSLFHRLAE
jgi:hypothetical protein